MLVALSNEVGFEQVPGDGGCGEWGSCVASPQLQGLMSSIHVYPISFPQNF